MALYGRFPLVDTRFTVGVDGEPTGNMTLIGRGAMLIAGASAGRIVDGDLNVSVERVAGVVGQRYADHEIARRSRSPRKQSRRGERQSGRKVEKEVLIREGVGRSSARRNERHGVGHARHAVRDPVRCKGERRNGNRIRRAVKVQGLSQAVGDRGRDGVHAGRRRHARQVGADPVAAAHGRHTRRKERRGPGIRRSASVDRAIQRQQVSHTGRGVRADKLHVRNQGRWPVAGNYERIREADAELAACCIGYYRSDEERSRDGRSARKDTRRSLSVRPVGRTSKGDSVKV